MNIYTRFLSAPLMMALAVSVSAATIVIPRNTVIPVTLDRAISSATNRAGNPFYAHQTVGGEGFPEQTKFTGNIDSVTRASRNTSGEIGVSFVSAKLPDGTRIPIVGQLTSLDDRSVSTDSSSGRLVGRSDTSKANLKFAAIGAGAGLVLGEVVGKKPLIGTLLGAAAGYLYGAKVAKPALGKDVTVAAGTSFGILLTEDVTIPDQWSAGSPDPIGAGPTNGWQVTFDNLQPVMRRNILMLPFRSVMDSMDMPFNYDQDTREIRVNDYERRAMHFVGTRSININGKATWMDARSRNIDEAIYVPASFIELLSNRTTYWNQRSGVLRIQ